MKKAGFLLLVLLINSFVFSQTKHPKDIDQVIRIPIVFHVVTDSLTKKDISGDTYNSWGLMLFLGFKTI